MVESDPIQRRLTNEWSLLVAAAAANPQILRVHERRLDGDTTIFAASLNQTTGLIGKPAALAQIAQHAFELRFPRFFPSAPIEAWLRLPVFHPNVHPENGFVCLWHTYSPRHTSVAAIEILQKVIRWEFYNLSGAHIMQPEAAAWIASGATDYPIPLPCLPLRNPEQQALGQDGYVAPSLRPRRPRLTPVE